MRPIGAVAYIHTSCARERRPRQTCNKATNSRVFRSKVQKREVKCRTYRRAPAYPPCALPRSARGGHRPAAGACPPLWGGHRPAAGACPPLRGGQPLRGVPPPAGGGRGGRPPRRGAMPQCGPWGGECSSGRIPQRGRGRINRRTSKPTMEEERCTAALRAPPATH